MTRQQAQPGQSIEMLRRWNGGDRAALEQLVRAQLPWIQARVRERLGAELRQKAESVDFVQEALIDFLEYGPRFELESEAQLRALLARIVENNIRDAHRHLRRKRRDIRREQAPGQESVLQLEPAAPSMQRPSRVLDREERMAWIRLGLELLEPEDRQVLELRDWEERSFVEIAQELGIGESAARMRYQRALPKLAKNVERLRRGELGRVTGS